MSSTSPTQNSSERSQDSTWPAGEVAFITGGASGIGLGMAKAFLAGGAKVAIADIAEDRLHEAAAELRTSGGDVAEIVLDVSDPAGWQSAADAAESQLGPVTVLCNNAGINGGTSAEKTSFELWRLVQSINIDAQFLGVSTFLPRFKKLGRSAHILNTASMAGLVPIANVSAYTASKFASVGFSLSLRDELAGSGIVVSVLCPGSVATRIADSAEEQQAKLEHREFNEAAVEQNRAVLQMGANPDRVGEQVVEAIGAGQFLIITHKEWLPLLERVDREEEQAFKDFDGRHGPDLTAQMMAQGEKPVSE